MRDFSDVLRLRRTIYSLDSRIAVSDDEVVNLVENAVKYTPSAFNSQNACTVILFKDNHKKLWDIVRDALRVIVPADNFSVVNKKIDGFAAAHGTILFYEDMSIVKSFQEKYPLYKDNFPTWSVQAMGMLQYCVWCSLFTKDIGASLQHYNPIIDKEVAKSFNIPESWSLSAQMPFGRIVQMPEDKTFASIPERVKVFK